MSEPATVRTATDWNGLKRLERTLPSSYYYDPGHHEREIERIWYRSWIYLCRADSLPEPLSFRTFDVGRQPIVVWRDEAGELRAFFNTCRHRGSLLCTEREGRLRAKSVTCPYHSWTYDLKGNLLRIPLHGRPKPLEVEDFPLYRVALDIWNGFVFVNLAGAAAPPLAQGFDPNAEALGRWPLSTLKVGHTKTSVIACNWKVFWENYNECLHCPNVHPALSSLVPIYRRAIMDPRDDPAWAEHAQSDDPQFRGGLRTGASSWSSDGQAGAHTFRGLSEEERRVGYEFVTALPSLYVVGHVDYVRAVRLRPLSAEETELEAQWLYPAEALADPAFDVHNSVDFAARVMAEDGAACELAQRGLRSFAHEAGVLLPEEYEVHRFQNWVRARLEAP